MKSALIISVNDPLEHDFTIYNKCVFLGETASLVDSQETWSCVVIDVKYQDLTLSQIISFLLAEPDLILLYVEPNQSRLALRLARLAKTVCSTSKILVFGFATTFLPQYFSRPPFDAVHVSGDREASILSYLKFIDNVIPQEALVGLRLVKSDGTFLTTRKGVWLDPSDWPTPKLGKLPLRSYQDFQEATTSVVDCRLGLAITATKGCGGRCKFCGCSEEEGITDRTRNPETILEWYNENSEIINDTFHLFSPNILSNAGWIRSFNSAYICGNYDFSWQGVTRTDTITEEVITPAAAAGLKRLSIGIEHINSRNSKPLKSSLGALENAARLCETNKIELVGLLMLGYPSQTTDDVRQIISLLKKIRIDKYRFTGYTPLHLLRSKTIADLDRMFLEDYDRRTFFSPEMKIPPRDFFEILTTNGECLI